jgi:hypothetical protein
LLGSSIHPIEAFSKTMEKAGLSESISRNEGYTFGGSGANVADIVLALATSHCEPWGVAAAMTE